MGQIDYYLVLGVDERSDETEIRDAYRRLARKYHPDVNPEDTRAAMRFKLISDAYRVLSNPTSRAAYTAPLPSTQDAPMQTRPLRRDTPVTRPPGTGATQVPSLAERLARYRKILLSVFAAAAALRPASTYESAPYRGNRGIQAMSRSHVAGFGQRLVASVIDMATLSIGLVLFILIIDGIGAIFGLGADASGNSNFNDFLVLVLFFSPIYFITLWTLYGRTLGCAIADIRVRQINGEALTVRVAALRWFSALLSSIPLFVGFLWLLRDQDGLAWHDRISGSLVLQEQPEQADFRMT